VGNAVAVDASGNVYVAGYENVPGGGSEMVLIKYAPLTLQRRADGSVILEAETTPGASLDFQASDDLQTWLDLGSAVADTNGVAQFDDTNAANFGARFYYTTPQ
jgi:hypothetical protein